MTLNKVIISPEILNYAKFTSPNMTPLKRKSGWTELASEKRGQGDLLDLIGSLVIFHELGKRNKICSVDMTCGFGDDKDIVVVIKGEKKSINIKTSSYGPYRDNLRLFVKEEELDKNIDAYIQCFVHLNQDEPHIHLAGWVATNSSVWLTAKKNVETIPNTGGHKGIGITLNKLGQIESLFNLVDNKF